MGHRHSGPEPFVGIVRSDPQIEGIAGNICLRYGLIVGVVIVIIIRNIHLGALELLISKPELQCCRQLSLEQLDFVSGLEGHRHVAVESGRFLLRHDSHAEPFAEKFQRHVSGDGKTLGSIVDTYPLHAPSGTQTDEVSRAYGGRIICRRDLIVLRELGIGLRRQSLRSRQCGQNQQKGDNMS